MLVLDHWEVFVKYFIFASFFLTVGAFALDSDEFECKAEVSWQEPSSIGEKWITNSESDTQNKRLKDDGPYSFLTLSAKVTGNEEELRYSLSVDKKTAIASLQVGSATLKMAILPGEQMGWSLGDPYGGADKVVTCRRGGEITSKPHAGVSCGALTVVIPAEFGKTPRTKRFQERPLKSTGGFAETTYFGKVGPTISTTFENAVATFWLGEMSGHLLDVFEFSVNEGKQFGIRRSHGSYGYSDIVCSAK